MGAKPKPTTRPTTKPAGNKPPRAVREYTAGGVVFRRRADEVEILMIQDRLGRWSIPKGHVEPGERIEQTALREVNEETGLSRLKLGQKLDKLHFFYRKEGKLIFMTTHVFLMEALGESDALIPGDSEGIVDAKWFPQAEALSLIEYRDTERLFRMALAKIAGQKLAPASEAVAPAAGSAAPAAPRPGRRSRRRRGSSYRPAS